ncbi:MAG TPA: histidine kinase dimerization/phospho-acceptor domain-containing protein [Nocardioides sp.]|nr:histidine kinase dimerization/phospho-acceptor domain-containing protein [Nocardioides sp.]
MDLDPGSSRPAHAMAAYPSLGATEHAAAYGTAAAAATGNITSSRFDPSGLTHQADGDVQVAAARTQPPALVALAVVVDHELRTPMTVLLGHSELLRETADDLPPDQRRSLHTLHAAVQDLHVAVVGACRLLSDTRLRASS